MRVFYFEPDYRGYRQSFLDGLKRHSRHEIVSFTLPESASSQARRCSLLPFLEKVSRQQEATKPRTGQNGSLAAARVDALITTDPYSLCDLYGLARQWLAGTPSAIVFHELSFAKGPVRRQTDQLYGLSLLHSLLAADRLFFSSPSHLEQCLDYLPVIVKQFPAFPGKDKVIQAIRQKSKVVRPGISLRDLDVGRHDLKYKSPTILWNLRWEKDKRPELFIQTLQRLAGEGLDFGVVICGRKPEDTGSQEEKEVEGIFEEARHRLGDRVFHFGYVASRAEYANLLWMSDIVVSTAEVHYFPAALIEAAFCDCYPLAPAAGEYPELIPGSQKDRFLYKSPDDLYARLKGLLMDPLEIGSAHLRSHMLPFEWEKAAKNFDQELVGLIPSYRTEVIA
jgi:glycosyltransferase involved in cell wall biosynthesis